MSISSNQTIIFVGSYTLHKSGFIPAEFIFVFVDDHPSASDPNDPVSNDPEFVYTCQIVNSATIRPSTVWSTILKKKNVSCKILIFSLSFFHYDECVSDNNDS